MAAKIKLNIISIVLILTVSFLPTPVSASNSSFSSLQSGLTAIIDSDEDERNSPLREIDIVNLISFQIVQQPTGNSNFVTPLPNYVTAYQKASKYGTIGLLAHNYLAGRYFFQILPGQEIELVYDDNQTDKFVVTEIQQYQALSPDSPSSDFIDLDTGNFFTTSKLFRKIYIGQADRLVLQTCIYADQNTTWGRLFIIAEPIE